MSSLRLASLSVLIVGCATGVEDSGFDTFLPTTAPPGDTGNGTSTATTGGSDSDNGTTTGVLSASATTTDDPTTTTNGDTTSDDTTGGATMTTANDSSSSSGGGMMGTEDLQNHDGSCEMVVWCTDNNTMEGVGPHAYAECFTNVSLTPPFDVTRVTYQVGQLQITPTQFTLEVRSWTGSGPGTVLGTHALTGTDAALGSHVINLTNPISVNASSFCVVVDGNQPFAISYDTANVVPDHSLLTADDCNLTTFNTLASIGYPGNLCISARIEN